MRWSPIPKKTAIFILLTKLGRSAIILSSLMVERTLLQRFASMGKSHYHVAVAQWIERFPAEEEVGGSNPLSNAFLFLVSGIGSREYFSFRRI